MFVVFCFTFFSVFANLRGPEKFGPEQTNEDKMGREVVKYA